MIELDVLGPLVARRDDRPVTLPGARHRTVLARLLVSRGRVVSADQLIDDLWGDDAPAQPLATLQSFVARLRRHLEPDRRPREPAGVLVTRPPGYALRPDRVRVDAWDFEDRVRTGGEVVVSDPAQARAILGAALASWSGPAYAEFVDHTWAAAEAARLDDLRLLAVERSADAGLRLGLAGEVVAELAPQVAAHPWREQGWALLATAQYAAGRQAEALATLRTARTMVTDELGVDPGPALRSLESDILHQAPHLLQLPASVRIGAVEPSEPDLFVGREVELERLLAHAVRGGVVTIVGEAGAGKTALVERLAAELRSRGWLHGAGACAETGGALPGWPWAQVVRALASERPPPADTEQAFGWLLRDDAPADPDPVAGQHRTRMALRDYLVGLCGKQPVLVVLDDVHRADQETLDLLVTVCGALAGRPSLVVVTRRGSEGSGPLDDALASIARHLPERLELRGLDPAAVAAILRAQTGLELDAKVVDALAERTGGNPFFVQETARLVAADGIEAAISAVPAGVREVLGRRIARLPDTARTVLVHAAVLGRGISLDVLTAMSGASEEMVLDSVEKALGLGLLIESDPGRLRFPHALVRDAAYESVSRLRRSRLHARAAATIEQLHPDDLAAIAHHYETAADPSLATATLRSARRAALEAERRYAYRDATRLWRLALTAMDRVGGPATERLELLLAQVRTLASAGDLVMARQLRAETLRAADAIGDPLLTARAIASFDVPTLWTNRPYGVVELDVVERTGRVLRELPPGDSEARCRMLIDLALELEGESDERGFAAARDAEAMARRLGDPELLVMALNATLLEHYWPGGIEERRRVGAELLALGRERQHVAAEVLGRMALAQTSCARGELDHADEHVAVVEQLAETYDQPLTAAIAGWYHGLRHVVAGELEPALQAYAEAARRMARVGMWQGEADTVTVAAGCAWLSVGRLGELAGRWDADSATAKGFPELYALTLARAGRLDDARATAGPPTPIRRDYAFDLNWAVRGLLGIAIEDQSRVEHAYRQLEPHAETVAGAGSAVLAIAPVGEILGELADYLGASDRAAAHYRTAADVARRAGATHWERRALVRSAAVTAAGGRGRDVEAESGRIVRPP